MAKAPLSLYYTKRKKNMEHIIEKGYIVGVKVQYAKKFEIGSIYENGIREGVVIEVDAAKERARVNWGGNRTWIKFSMLNLA
jgi:hypothetical protein